MLISCGSACCLIVRGQQIGLKPENAIRFITGRVHMSRPDTHYALTQLGREDLHGIRNLDALQRQYPSGSYLDSGADCLTYPIQPMPYIHPPGARTRTEADTIYLCTDEVVNEGPDRLVRKGATADERQEMQGILSERIKRLGQLGCLSYPFPRFGRPGQCPMLLAVSYPTLCR
ncbi:uncharacterized protein BDV17DRAFT_222419 [Aspergillus undulatus]|uniref:uncharacterized protein n=1 Tax=Aspergillus undulatus TaxID=1810928 RepID=UPI003CCCBA53